MLRESKAEQKRLAENYEQSQTQALGKQTEQSNRTPKLKKLIGKGKRKVAKARSKGRSLIERGKKAVGAETEPTRGEKVRQAASYGAKKGAELATGVGIVAASSQGGRTKIAKTAKGAASAGKKAAKSAANKMAKSRSKVAKEKPDGSSLPPETIDVESTTAKQSKKKKKKVRI